MLILSFWSICLDFMLGSATLRPNWRKRRAAVWLSGDHIRIGCISRYQVHRLHYHCSHCKIVAQMKYPSCCKWQIILSMLQGDCWEGLTRGTLKIQSLSRILDRFSDRLLAKKDPPFSLAGRPRWDRRSNTVTHAPLEYGKCLETGETTKSLEKSLFQGILSF